MGLANLVSFVWPVGVCVSAGVGVGLFPSLHVLQSWSQGASEIHFLLPFPCLSLLPAFPLSCWELHRGGDQMLRSVTARVTDSLGSSVSVFHAKATPSEGRMGEVKRW